MKTPGKALTVAVIGAVAVGLFAAATPANADGVPTGTDVVGVGSDVVQYAVDFVADGDTLGDAGYNSAGNVNRLIDFDATGDGNGRAGYLNGSTLATSKPQNPTVILREGTSPVERPNGGGAGVKALIADGVPNQTTPETISFARSPNLPTATQQGAALANLGTNLHVVQVASDQQVIATATTTHAPSGLSVDELVKIYSGQITTWNELPGNSGGSHDTIIPLIPPTSAGVYTTFVNALKAANNNTPVTLSGVTTVEQNDPTAISTLPADQQVDAIVPFPASRLDLYNNNYFLNPNAIYGVGAAAPTPVSAGIQLLTSTAPDGEASFTTPLPYYIIFRESDEQSTTPWQPGSTLNWVQALFSNTSSSVKPYFESAAGQALISASGATPAYHDLGDVSFGP